MTCIEYGGGPSLEQRREFSGLRQGSHISGYRGFVPQFKYSFGGTYDDLTHEISQKLPYYSGPPGTIHLEQENKSYGPNGVVFLDELPKPKLPISTGFNKLTEKMVPGYSGDIPHAPFKFGATYRALCDESIDEFVTTYEQNQQKHAELIRTTKLFPKMRATGRDPALKDHMNLWVDGRSSKLLRQDRKEFTEPPIPGYNGYVPRVNTTEAGLGQRYHVTSFKGLTQFQRESSSGQSNPGHHHRISAAYPRVQSAINERVVVPNDEDIHGGRVYVPPGMIPKYTGYLPRGRYEFGHTYGDMTRSLDVCAHPYGSYGQFIRSKSAMP